MKALRPPQVNPKRRRAVSVRVVRGPSPGSEKRFTGTFTVGREADCGVQVLDASVAPHHVQILFDGVLWWVRDLNTGVGTLLDGARVQVVPLPDSAKIELGKGGPLLAIDVVDEEERPAPAPPESPPPPASSIALQSEAQIIERYLRPVGDGPIGAQTMMIRRAFERVQKQSSRRYRLVIGAFLV